MGFAIAIVMILAAAVIGWIDRYGAQRDYADRYAARYGQIPPLVDWFFASDSDPEVESYRLTHRNLYILGGVLAGGAAIVALLSAGTTGT